MTEPVLRQGEDQSPPVPLSIKRSLLISLRRRRLCAFAGGHFGNSPEHEIHVFRDKPETQRLAFLNTHQMFDKLRVIYGAMSLKRTLRFVR